MSKIYILNSKITNVKCQFCNDTKQHDVHHLCYSSNTGGFVVIGNECHKVYRLKLKCLFYDIHKYLLKYDNVTECVRAYIRDKVENCSSNDLSDITSDIKMLMKRKFDGQEFMDILEKQIKEFHDKFGDYDIRLLGGYTDKEIRDIIAIDDFVELEERIFIYLSSK